MQLSDSPLAANVPALDIQRAMRWYEEKLGLKPVMDLGVSGQLYRTGGVYWLIYQTPSAGTGKHTLAGQFAFSVCTDETCLMEKRDLTLVVDVK